MNSVSLPEWDEESARASLSFLRDRAMRLLALRKEDQTQREFPLHTPLRCELDPMVMAVVNEFWRRLAELVYHCKKLADCKFDRAEPGLQLYCIFGVHGLSPCV